METVNFPTVNKKCVSHVSVQLLFIVAVSHISWYDEDKSFAVAYVDGVISICSREEYELPVSVEAHEVHQFIGVLSM